MAIINANAVIMKNPRGYKMVHMGMIERLMIPAVIPIKIHRAWVGAW